MKTTIRLWTRWTPLLALTATLAACGAAVAPDPATTAPATTAPADRQATCIDSAIRLPDLDPRGIHGAIVSDTLHMGGATAPATCTEPANQSLAAGLPPIPAGRTEQAQSRYYLIVINYPGGNRLYVVSRRPDGSSCVVDTNDQCIAQVTDLPDDFDLKDLPEDVRPTIPAGRPAPPTVSPPPAVEPPPNGYTPPAVSPPPGDDGAPAPAAGTAPDAAGTPQPSNGATGVAVGGPLLSWAYAPRALSYDVYWGTTKELAADAERGTPINTSSTFVTIAASASLEHETLYYWRVDAKNEAGTTQGAVWSFTTAPAPAPAPAPAASLPQPPDGATGVIRGPELIWPAVPGAVSYDLYVGTARDLTEDTLLQGWTWPINRTNHSFHSFTRGSTRFNTLYYWRIDARTETGAISRGAVWSFTTTAPLPAPSDRQPSDGATGVTVDRPLLSWAAPPGAEKIVDPAVQAGDSLLCEPLCGVSYRVTWSRTKLDPGRLGFIRYKECDLQRPGDTATCHSLRTSSTSVRLPTNANLARNATYYWYVTVWYGSDSSSSPIWSFTTAPAPAPAASAEE